MRRALSLPPVSGAFFMRTNPACLLSDLPFRIPFSSSQPHLGELRQNGLVTQQFLRISNITAD